MTDKKMRKKVGTRLLAGILAAGMMAAQPAFVFAAEQGIAAAAEMTRTEESGEMQASVSVPVSGKASESSESQETAAPPEPTEAPAPTEIPQPTVTPELTQEPKPTETPEQAVTPKPAETPEPDTDSKPSGSQISDQNSQDTVKQEDTKDQQSEDQQSTAGESADSNGTEETGQEPSDSAEEEISEEEPEAQSNEALIAQQQIIELPVIVQDFRFWTVTRKYAFATKDLSVLEEMKEEAREIGALKKKGLCYVLKEEENGWLYVESGTVRGFVKAADVLTGEEAQEILEHYQDTAKKKAEKTGREYTGIEMIAPTAKELVSARENKAFLHIRATVNQTVVEKDYALVKADKLNVREEKNTDSRIVGILKEENLCYILADKDKQWVYVESGDVRGFVKKEYLDYGDKVTDEIEEKGEDSYTFAQETVKPGENAACYYTFTSVRSGVPGGEIRSSLVEFAAQFIGNPYVYGGTSLTNGTDCSGFTQSIYREYGYSLPRTSGAQSQYGTQIPVEDAKPGDLVFYAKDGKIYHVVIYAGDGKTIEAMGEKYGIVQANLDTAHAVWATRILDDTEYAYTGGGIGEVNVTPDQYGEALGTYTLTYYCSCEICCGRATGITATGAPVIEGQTIAVDPNVIPYGTKVVINGHIFTAEDCGGGVNGRHIDIYVSDHARALALGVGCADVYLLK